MKKYLNWVYTFSKASSSERKKMRSRVLEGIMKRASSDRSRHTSKEQTEQMVRFLEGKDSELVGFVPEISYFREQGSGKNLEALYVHAFGGPALLYKIKGLPCLILASPTIHYNDSYLRDLKNNVIDPDIIGVTG